MDLTDEQLLNPKRNEIETTTQYKARRRVLRSSLDEYTKRDVSALKLSYIGFVRLCFILSVKKNDWVSSIVMPLGSSYGNTYKENL